MMLSSLSSSPSLSLLLLLLLLLSILPSAWAANQSTESMVYPGPHPEAYRSLSLAISLIGVSVLSFCIARRPAGFRVEASPSQRFLAALLIDSWVFIFSSALMISGIGLSLNSNICTGAIFICILFYGLSKALIYMFLAERVYTVHAGANRLKSTVYRICQVFLLGFGVVFALGTWGRIAFLRDGTTHTFPFTHHIMDGTDNACVIGLARPASTSLLVYDLFLNVLFTSLFLYPLYRSRKLTTPLRKLAKRTLCAALVALVTSAANIAILTALHGQQLGWVCLGSCGTDVIINALALFFVTRSYDDTASKEPINTVTQIRHQSVMPILHTSEHQQGLAPHRSVEFPVTERAGRSATIDGEMAITSELGTASRWATSKLSTTVGTVNDGVEKPKDQPKNSYTSPTGMVTIEGVISGEKGKVRKKPSIDLADVDGVDMPTCSTPDGEETEVQIRSEGRPPRARSGSHSRANSWSGSGQPPSAHPDLDLDLEADAHGADKALFRAAGNNNDEGGAQTPSSMVVVSVRTPTEVHVDPVLEPRFDPDQRQGRNLRRSSVLVEHKEDLETGL